jgi:hypothetical protein
MLTRLRPGVNVPYREKIWMRGAAVPADPRARCPCHNAYRPWNTGKMPVSHTYREKTWMPWFRRRFS